MFSFLDIKDKLVLKFGLINHIHKLTFKNDDYFIIDNGVPGWDVHSQSVFDGIVHVKGQSHYAL